MKKQTKKKSTISDAERYGVTKVIVREVISYPFDKWFAKPQCILKQGVHFGLDAFKFAQQIRNEASERGLSVGIKVKGECIALVVWDRVE